MLAVRGMSWMLWQRNRPIVIGAGGYMAVFGLVLALVGSKQLPMTVSVLSVLLLCFAFLCLLGMFIYPEADVGSAASSYPHHFFTLPVRTGQLVFLPMLLGSVAVFGSSWLITAAARHANVEIAPWWPATSATAILALLQAIFWNPTGFPYSKLLLTIVALPTLLLGMQVAFAMNVPESTVCSYLGAIIVASYGAAYFGVAKARRGDLPFALKFNRAHIRDAKPIRFRPLFSSPLNAQVWYELKLHGLVLPVISAIVFLLLSLPLIWNDSLSPLPFLGQDNGVRMPTIPTMLLIYYPCLFALIPFTAWVIGCGARRTDIKRGSGNLHLFYATRPQTEWSLVLAKVAAAAKSTTIAWGLVVLASVPLLLMTGGVQQGDYLVIGSEKPLILGLWQFVDLEVLLRIGAFLALVAILTFRNYVLGFWTELSGRLWMRHGYPVLTGVAILTVIFSSSLAPPNTVNKLLSIPNLQIILWTAVVIKLAVASWLVSIQMRRGILTMAGLLKAAAFYAIAFVSILTLVVLLSLNFRTELALISECSVTTVTSAFVALIIYLMPMVRILAAPMTLAANRHARRS